MVDLLSLDRVVKETIDAIEKGKEQIYDIAESAKKEYIRVKNEVRVLKIQAKDIIQDVDRLERQAKAARLRLLEVDSHFREFTEAEIKNAYEQAQEYQVLLTMMREREAQIRSKRNELELSLRNLEATVQKAENLVAQVGVVLDFISGNLKEVNEKMEELQQRQQIGIQVIKAQEEERKRIAREIHDGPAQAMANVVLRTEFCEKLLDVNPYQVREELQNLKELVRGTLGDVRKIIFDLRPMSLDDLGLVPALKRYLADYKDKYGLEGEFVFFGQERRLDSALEVGLFRVIQEGLNNVWKHAKASKVQVKLEIGNDRLLARVKDNGQGFDLPTVLANTRRESLGLISMRERVELLGGEITFNSALGQGAEILVNIPL
ncbi:MAG: sensor histidine kinase [Clostridia bacterium]|nr:sensor histidine kinase [Clostridia bacterium]